MARSCPAEEDQPHGIGKRRWTDKVKRKIVEAVRPRSRRAATEVVPSDVVDVDKHRLQREIAEYKARRRRSGEPVLQEEDSRPNYGREDTPAAFYLDARPKKGILKVRTAVASPSTEDSATTLVETLFPTGVLGKPPERFRSSGPENVPAFLMSVIAEKNQGAGGRTRIDRELVEQWSKAKEDSLRRGRYLRDFCPLQRDDEEVTPEETLLEEPDPSDSEDETLPAEPDHSEEVPPVKTGLPFDSPASEAAFVKAIISRHLLKDDFINRHAFEKSCDQFMRQQSLKEVESFASAGGCPKAGRRRKVTFRDC